MVEVGKLAFVKTSGEVGYVLAVGPEFLEFALDSEQLRERHPAADGVAIRIPSLSQQFGITHSIQYFLPEELETLEERVTRDQAERKLLVSLAGAAAKDSLLGKREGRA